jgi:hypothetical protein
MACLLVFDACFLLGIVVFKGLTARRLYKSFGVKGLIYMENILIHVLFSSKFKARISTPFHVC